MSAVNPAATTATETSMVRFDDLNALREVIARGFGDWGPDVTLDQDTADSFATATSTPARTDYAPDYLLPSLLPKLRPANDWRIGGHKSALNIGCPQIRFLRPAPIGATVRCRSRLASAESRPRGIRMTMEFEVENVAAEGLCMRLSIELLYQGEAA